MRKDKLKGGIPVLNELMDWLEKSPVEKYIKSITNCRNRGECACDIEMRNNDDDENRYLFLIFYNHCSTCMTTFVEGNGTNYGFVKRSLQGKSEDQAALEYVLPMSIKKSREYYKEVETKRRTLSRFWKEELVLKEIERFLEYKANGTSNTTGEKD